MSNHPATLVSGSGTLHEAVPTEFDGTYLWPLVGLDVCGSRPCMCGLWDDDDDEDCPASPETRTTP